MSDKVIAILIFLILLIIIGSGTYFVHYNMVKNWERTHACDLSSGIMVSGSGFDGCVRIVPLEK